LPAVFGAKARGLLWLPPAWVPAFFTISPEVHGRYRNLAPVARMPFLTSLDSYLREACGLVDIEIDTDVLLRSNAARETLRERGRYTSTQTPARDIPTGLARLYEMVEGSSPGEPIGVIVQRYVPAALKGHLSNERRVAEEYRDALVEF